MSYAQAAEKFLKATEGVDNVYAPVIDTGELILRSGGGWKWFEFGGADLGPGEDDSAILNLEDFDGEGDIMLEALRLDLGGEANA